MTILLYFSLRSLLAQVRHRCLCESECKSKNLSVACGEDVCVRDDLIHMKTVHAHAHIDAQKDTHKNISQSVFSAVRLAQWPDGDSIWIIIILLSFECVLVNQFSYSIILIMDFVLCRDGIRSFCSENFSNSFHSCITKHLSHRLIRE